MRRGVLLKTEFSGKERIASRYGTRLFSGSIIVLCIAGAKVLFHLLTANRYGIFRDELYYLACAEHLDWGYVDQPPLIAIIAWIERHAFGDSLLAVRLLPALALDEHFDIFLCRGLKTNLAALWPQIKKWS